MTAIDSWSRTIVHADMDAFYAAIEQLDDPALRGRPVLVGPASGRGVVLTASYEARPFGVGSAMSMAVARRRCPQALVVPPRFERYQQVSVAIMQVFRDFSPRVEPISLDEAFLDMSGSEHIFGSPDAVGRRLKSAIRDATGGLTASVGVSVTKFVAKVASSYRKPDGLTIVPEAAVAAWLAPQPVARLWGAGPKTQRRLATLGLETVGDVASADPAWLETELGAPGRRFHSLANGRDDRAVAANRQARSLSCERTLAIDTGRLGDIEAHLRLAADTVSRRLRQAGLVAGGIRVKLKTADFRILSRQHTLAVPSAGSEDLFRTAVPLAIDMLEQGPFRLIGIGAYDLASGSDEGQLDFLKEGTDKSARLDRVLDQANARFGAGALTRARRLRHETVLDESADLDFLEQDEQIRRQHPRNR
jgi:DNA polymerase-4